MNDKELIDAYNRGRRVVIVNSDYHFEGEILAYFYKRDGKSIRCVVESADRICLIQSAKNLELVR